MTDTDVTVTIPAGIKPDVLDGLVAVRQDLEHFVRDCEEFPDEYSDSDHRRALRRVDAIRDLWWQIKG